MAAIWDDSKVEHRYIKLDEVTLHTVVGGDGPLVVLLHGFPEFWYSWRYQIPALMKEGYRVAVPDMRGYNLSSKPEGISSYGPAQLTGDVKQLIEALGEKRAIVAGHDWGANVAWMFAMRYPEHLDRLIICNVPHPVVFMKHFYTWRQGVMRSWYVVFFQLPWLPEMGLRARDFRSLRSLLRKDPVHEDSFSDEDIERYVEAMKQPGALTAAINYYRAIFRVSKDDRRQMVKPIQAPTLLIWGMKDRFLGPELVDTPASLVPNLQIARIDDSSHWVQCDAHEKVNELMLDFLKSTPPSWIPKSSLL